jgi:hypothetical protein
VLVVPWNWPHEAGAPQPRRPALHEVAASDAQRRNRIERKNRHGRGGGRGGGQRRPGRGQSGPFRPSGGFSGRRSEPPARRQPTTYNATGRVANEEEHADDHAALRAIAEPVQSLIFDEASLGADGDKYDGCVFDDPSARVYGEKSVLCARTLARAAPADSNAHFVCSPPEVLVSDCTLYVLSPTPDVKKLLASLASPLDCFKDALAGLLGFFTFG